MHTGRWFLNMFLRLGHLAWFNSTLEIKMKDVCVYVRERVLWILKAHKNCIYNSWERIDNKLPTSDRISIHCPNRTLSIRNMQLLW